MNTSPPSLDEQLASLPRSIEPPQDLWPAIAASISQPRRRGWPIALAAALLLALIGADVRYAWHQPSIGPLDAHVASPSAVTAVSFESPRAPAYLAARAEAERTFHERLKLLMPETRAKIETNLKIIQDANAQIRAALDADPASPLLLQLLQNTQRQEIDLYTNVARNTEPALARSSL